MLNLWKAVDFPSKQANLTVWNEAILKCYDKKVVSKMNHLYAHNKGQLELTRTHLKCNKIFLIPSMKQWDKQSQHLVKVIFKVLKYIDKSNFKENAQATTHNLLKRKKV